MTTDTKNKTTARTTVTIDDSGLVELMRLGGFKTKSAAARYAVEQALRRKILDEVDKMRGKIEFDDEALGCDRFSH